MVTLSYMWYMPWGKDNIFNWFAREFHDWVDGRANVPFLGYSWLYMFLDVQFQLFATFSLYALFILMVVHNFEEALRCLKRLSDDENVAPCINEGLYRHLDTIVKARLQNDMA